MTLAELVKNAHERALRKGWWDEELSLADGKPYLDRSLVESTIPEKLCLIHSEVSEALEVFRGGDLGQMVDLDTGKPEGFDSELADIVIRVADLCGALGIDLQHAVESKSAFNETRPKRHGGKRC